MTTRLWVAPLCLFVVACSSGKDGAADKAKKPVGDLAKQVNAKLTAKATVRFETKTVGDNEFSATVAVPKGWVESDKFPGSFRPPKSAKLGFMTSFSVDIDCAGACVAKDWKAVITKEMARLDGVVIVDESLANNGRIKARKFGKGAAVWAAWYKPKASNFFSCRATLDNGALAEQVNAFIESCKTVSFSLK